MKDNPCIMGIDFSVWQHDESIVVSKCGRICRLKPSGSCYELKQSADRDGYLRVSISRRHLLVHRVVYETFVSPLVHGLVVCHLDGNKKNNHVSNLLQATQRENISHKVGHGTQLFGDMHPRCKIPDAVMAKIKNAYKALPRGPSGRIRRGAAKALAQSFGVSLNIVTDIRRGSRVIDR